MDPTQKIPNEILQQIFLNCCDGQPIVPPPKRSSTSYRIERLLSHVSNRWRNVATDTPRMWTRIAISWEALSRSRTRIRGPQVDRMEAYLSRSRHAPLDIFWRHIGDTSEPGDKEKDKEFWEAVEMFRVHSSRWKTLRIETDTQVAASSFLHMVYLTSAPTLQIMNLDFCGIPDFRLFLNLYPTDHPKTTLYPSLTRVELGGWNLRHVPGPFSQVLTLVVTLTNLMLIEHLELTAMLKLLPSLEVLVWKRPPKGALILSANTIMKTVTLVRLRTMAFFTPLVVDDHTALVMCRAISAPNLSSLHLTNHTEPQIAPLARHFLSALSYPNLQTLDLRPACCNTRIPSYHNDGGVLCRQWMNSLVTVNHLIFRSDTMSTLLLHPDLRAAFSSLHTLTAICNHEPRKHPKKCKTVAFLRKLIMVRLENQPFEPSELQVRLFKPCSRAKSNEGVVTWMREKAEVLELDDFPDELLVLDGI